MIRLLTWNILHGGGPKRAPEIALRLIGHRPDLVVLCEFRRTFGGQIAAVLADRVLVHQASTEPGPGTNGVLIASRWPIVRGPTPAGAVFERRWLEVAVPSLELNVIGVHIPDDSRPDDKARCWRAVVDRGRELKMKKTVVLGDFNTGRHHEDEPGATLGCTGLMGALCTLGFVDAWRERFPTGREYSWYSRTGAGFRVDHAFVSKPLRGELAAAWFSHAEREERVSDHSALLVELALGAPADRR